MAFERDYSEKKPHAKATCQHLRSKAIYVTGQLRTPDHPDEINDEYCWCNKTQHLIGPDQRDVERRVCVPGRQCFEKSLVEIT